PLLLLLLVLPLPVLYAARRLRALRHRRRGARGAWTEVLDYLLLAGRPAERRESATQIAEQVRTAFALPEVGALAVAAEREAFAPADPGAEPAWAGSAVLA